MTVGTVIQERLAEVSVDITANRLALLCADHGLTVTDAYVAAMRPAIDGALLEMGESVLLRPDVKEGSLEIKWDRKQVGAWCDGLRVKLGLTTSATVSQPVVRDASNKW